MPHVAILIVHYNAEVETRACLQSLRKIRKTNLTVSIVVVDNGSKEPLQISEKEQPPKTTILRSDSNLGFTDGNNLALKFALEHGSPDYVLLLNNDTTVAPDFLEELVKSAETNPRAGIITPKIFFSPSKEFHHESYTSDQRGKVFWYAGGSIDWPHFDAFHRGVDEVDRGHFDAQKDSEFATGCCALIPKKIIDKVGFFDSRYFLYLEDVDLSLRVLLAGYKIVFCPTAQIWHENAGSSGGSGSTLHQYYQTRNRLFFFSKYHDPQMVDSGVKKLFKIDRKSTRLNSS